MDGLKYLNPLTLSFKGDHFSLEKDFRRDNIIVSLPRIRSALLLVTFLYGIFGLLDGEMAGDAKNAIWMIRFLIVVPSGLIVFFLSHRPFFINYSQPLLFLLCYLGAAGIITMIALAPNSPASSSYYAGLILILITIHTFLQMNITWGGLCNLAITLSFEIVTNIMTPLPRNIQLNNQFFFLAASFICVAAGYLNEINVRNRYLLQFLLNREKENVIQQKKKMEVLGTMSSGIAHDLNNMLTSLQGYTELSLNEAPTDSSIQPYLEEVFHVSHRAKYMTEEILQFIRGETDEPGLVNTESLLKGVENYIRPLLSTSISFSWCNGVNTPFRSDEYQLHRILINLCTNSLHAMEETGGMLQLEARNNPEGEISIEIRDTGPGIPLENREKIFDPFYTTKQIGRGTGLGLFVVKQLLERLGGRIVLESEEGKGTVFTLFLPLGNG